MKLLDVLRNRLPAVATSHRSPFRPGATLEQSKNSAMVPSGISDTINEALRRAGLITQAQRAMETEPDSGAPIDRPASRAVADHAEGAGAFLTKSFANAAGRRDYKLYVPKGYASSSSARMPLVVMLHGCRQSPDDFAAGTRMNELAETHGFLVAYPAQAARANGSNCWNWFLPTDQRREEGEPSLIAGIAREVAGLYRIDDRRIFVAGLSAGAAMAVILGTTCPDLFAKVGVHSGLAYGAAHDVPSAFEVMRNGPGGTSHGPRQDRSFQRAIGVTVPMILFHGDRDATVGSGNANALIAQTLAAVSGGSEPPTGTSATKIAGGLRCTQTVYSLGANTIVEDWRIHGAGHAWSGGSTAGSFTDPNGPDASREMVRFFLG